VAARPRRGRVAPPVRCARPCSRRPESRAEVRLPPPVPAQPADAEAEDPLPETLLERHRRGGGVFCNRSVRPAAAEGGAHRRLSLTGRAAAAAGEGVAPRQAAGEASRPATAGAAEAIPREVVAAEEAAAGAAVEEARQAARHSGPGRGSLGRAGSASRSQSRGGPAAAQPNAGRAKVVNVAFGESSRGEPTTDQPLARVGCSASRRPRYQSCLGSATAGP
jgi:hypothetical protein